MPKTTRLCVLGNNYIALCGDVKGKVFSGGLFIRGFRGDTDSIDTNGGGLHQKEILSAVEFKIQPLFRVGGFVLYRKSVRGLSVFRKTADFYLFSQPDAVGIKTGGIAEWFLYRHCHKRRLSERYPQWRSCCNPERLTSVQCRLCGNRPHRYSLFYRRMRHR